MIRLSRLSDYGIVLMTRLAREPERALPASVLARESAVSPAMTGKILKLLARAELLVSHRGAHGGYALARAPERITIAEIIEALDGPIALTSCLRPSAEGCGIEALCPARTNWQRINRAIRDALAEVTLAEMARPVLEFGPAPFVSEHASPAVRDPAALAGTS
ncbi:MAG: SUF system Fe-S cluster assembly regulator [Geminicoccaceae bacterium]|nr:SUF system Fe-S cluster assembly regulator [Geminicoccaceae bacterium]MCS7266805.1 SUF system Fe-S cluster assembly regulator [Geminicoccaceae bacterium]MCX7629051.1 SUF system Fe-S cluster assembly regulator [Geminicoccaceae bacterium]MDW8123826.1 SUF system Fe-S cluster assembly regulator [Geminicoccaceae bacterium]MDW8341196.1 SUF system Fe-S cluster assembly regulator [Geminicoccaceae bacterium]